MHSQATIFSNTNQLIEALTCKKLLEESLSQLESLANQHQLSFQCISDIRNLLNTASKMHLFEELDNNQIKNSEIELYQFLNQFYQYEIPQIIIMYGFIQKEDQVIACEKSNQAIDNFKQIKEYVARSFAKLLRLRRVKEFDFFQKMESPTIQAIKNKLETNNDNYYISDALVNTNMLEEYGKKRFIFLCAALLKEGIDYSKIFEFGLREIRDPGSFIDNHISHELAEHHRKEREHHAATVESIKYYLYHLPLISHHTCSYEDIPKTIHAMKLNPQYSKIINRIELHKVFGDYVYPYEIYFQIRKKYGCIDNLELSVMDEIKWITFWRDHELANLIKQAKPYPDLVEKLIPLKNNKINAECLSCDIIITGIGNIGELILALNAREMSNITLDKLLSNDFNLFPSADKTNIPWNDHISDSATASYF